MRDQAWIGRVLGAAVLTAVAAAPALGQRALIDIGFTDAQAAGSETVSPDANGNTWNNFGQGQFIGDLLDVNGDSTNIGFGATTALPIGSNGGLTNPDPVFLGDFAVVEATQDYAFANANDANATTIAFELSGLNAQLSYNFRFFGSRTASEVRETQYTATGGNGAQSASLVTGGPNIGSDGASFGNDNIIVSIDGVTPQANGTILVEFTPVQSDFAYLNVLEVEAIAPVTFTAQPDGSIADAGGQLAFSAGVDDGGAGATYQWLKDGVELADDSRNTGATTPSLTIDSATTDDVGEYELRVDVAGASAFSDVAVGAVRSSGDRNDVNNDGVVDFFDLSDLLNAL